ncbi:MAG: glycosyl hydrolase family 65 protein [Planctomycetota bacterium]
MTSKTFYEVAMIPQLYRCAVASGCVTFQTMRATGGLSASASPPATRRKTLAGKPPVAPLALALVLLICAPAAATPDYVEHTPNVQVYNQSAGVTMRNPKTPREGEAVDLYFKIAPSFSYTSVAVYYTDDGSTPDGSKGVPSPGTMVLLSYGPDIRVTFLYNEPVGVSGVDWWHAQMPYFTRDYGERIRYKVGAWDTGAPSTPEVFAGAGTVYEYTNKLAWPGAGSGSPTPDEGYPPVHFWKEEAVAGNNYINVMLDRNGSVYDIYYPSAGCVYGMGTKNEGYSDGADTYPPGLPPDHRGQMNLNQAMPGLRVDGMTYWLSNEAGGDYVDVTQSYVTDTNVILTSQRLVAGGNDILVQQYDFSPKGITFPTDDGAQPNQGLHIKRIVLTNNGATAKTVNFYWHADFALNGGDSYDGTFTDAARGAMIGYDNTQRWTSASGEYNPTTTGDYNKDVSVYLAAAVRLSDSVGASSGTPATDFWSDTSADEGLGWVGMQVELPVGVPKEIGVLFVGGFDNVGGATGTYDYYMDGAIDWFHTQNLAALQTTTETYWTDWLAAGLTVDMPDDRYDEIFKRGLLGTALHLDGENGGVIAGMHNGAYPFVWPRDGVWAAVTLDRTGHTAEAAEVYRFLRDIAYRAEEEPGRKGWWYQKYTTDGYIVWSSPQVDETSAYPWGIDYHYALTGDLTFLEDHYVTVYEAARASSEDSNIDGRLYYDDTYDLMHSNNLWEDSWDLFLYSNATVERGLRDAADIADILDQLSCPGGPGTCNYHNDRALYLARADAIHGGMDARLAWDGENTDISMLGLSYPFDVYDTTDPAIAHMADRMNGIATDTWGNNHPIVNFTGEWEGLINRYWGDGYWNGGPWFLSTLWYGCYYAERQDANPDKGDIDNHAYRMDLLLDRLGPIGFGAEQIAPSNSLQYPGQGDFLLQTAWPNAWESMSFLVDAVMMFLDFTPDAAGNTLRIEPKMPSAWSTMTFNNLVLGNHRIDVTCAEDAAVNSVTFTNQTGDPLDYDVHIRVPSGSDVIAVTQEDGTGCTALAFTHDPATGRVHVQGAMDTGAASTTTVNVHHGLRGDFDFLNGVDTADLPVFVDVLLDTDTGCINPAIADMDANGRADGDDVQFFVSALLGL